MQQQKKGRVLAFVAMIIGFAIVLTGFRVFWIDRFTDPEQSDIVGGELDLRGWDFSEGRTITLDGEWEFYPYTWYKEDAGALQEMIQVPGDWSEVLNPEDESPYGYGSYRLRILVDPDSELTYGIQVPSVRSSSALYVNDLLAGKSGEIGESKETAIARNVPYVSSSIRADETGIIDVVLYVSNFEDPRGSGFVRSMKFGDEEGIIKRTKLSTVLQVASAAIFSVHALFACLLYLIGARDRRLIYFSIAIFVAAFSSLMGGDEKVLLDYIPMSYTGAFKLSFILIITLSWALLQSTKPQIDRISKFILPVFTVLYLLAIGAALVLPMESLTFASLISLSSSVIAAIICVCAFILVRKEVMGSIWLMLSLVALASHFGWWGYSLGTGLKTVYYPFDLIIAIVCFAGVWFKKYHQMFIETDALANELQKADEAKDAFLVNTSHELRNPLHSILNISEAVLERERIGLSEKSVRDLKTVLSVSRQMSFMVNEMLDMASLKEGNPRLDLQAVSLPAVTEGVMDMLAFKVERRPIQIVNDIPADFPHVVADENRLIQVLFNLLHNAMKFTYEGEVVVYATVENGRAQIKVSDTGLGIDENVLSTIFEPYRQSYDDKGGLGLGLSICKQLVELHGSTLEVQSELGKGTSFSFSLAVSDQPVSNYQAENSVFSSDVVEVAAREEQLMKDTEHVNRPRILVVDDDPVNLQVIETILSNEDYALTTVLSGEEVLSLLNKQEWDLVISDVMMPKMSGYALTEKIRERFTMSELPVLLVTARSGQVDLEKGFSVGANDYIKKPVDAEEVRLRVRALTAVKRSMRERLNLEVAWLQAQIQPHFLFNALNAIMALSHIDTERMQNALGAFSDILRRKFQFDSIHQLTPIKEELELVEAYLLIEQERFQERLQVVWDIDEDIQTKIPSLTIQPFVENAIHHGLMRHSEGGKLLIRVAFAGDAVEITIQDDGVGMEQSKVNALLTQRQTVESGVGLRNTHLRLKRHYGEGLSVVSEPGVGTTVSFRIPFVK